MINLSLTSCLLNFSIIAFSLNLFDDFNNNFEFGIFFKISVHVSTTSSDILR